MLQVLEVGLLSLGKSQQLAAVRTHSCADSNATNLTLTREQNQAIPQASVSALPGSTKEALGRQRRLLFGHGAAHQLRLAGSFIPICSQLHLQPQPVVPLF